MTGKVAVITGASQGIGAGLVAGYRGRGWAVVASARTIMTSPGPDLLAVAGDIADPATAGRIIGAAPDRFGRIDTGIIQTPVHPEKSCDHISGRLVPLGRAGQVSDVVDAVMFLESSPYITGEILHIDGGQIAGH